MPTLDPGRRATLRTGERYTGIQQFAGSGFSRSCSRCHGRTLRPLRKLSPWGMCCPTCLEEVSARRARERDKGASEGAKRAAGTAAA